MCWQPLPDTSISLPTFKKDQLKPLEGNRLGLRHEGERVLRQVC